MITQTAILGLWLLSLLKSTLFHAYLWQLKEYRFDRMIPHLKLKTSRKMFFSPLFLVKWLSLIAFLIMPMELKNWLAFVVLIFFLIDSFDFLRRILIHQLVRPRFTLRTIEIVSSSLFLIVIAIWLFVSQLNLWTFAFCLLLFERLIPIAILLQVFLTKLPVFLTQKRKIKIAKEKIEDLPNLKIVGVTGSYGKTSTKDFIAQILAKKYKVAKTEGTNNTKIGISQNIIEKIDKDTEIFVVEMGAYKKGEINDICQLIQPRMAVVTGINEQHLAIFGSLKNLIEAKYEIIENLPKNGIAILNGNNHYCLEMAKKASKNFKTILYKTSKPRKLTGFANVIWLDSITEKQKGTSFKVYDGDRHSSFKTNFKGESNLDNLLGAIAVAKELGLTGIQIKEAINQLQPNDRAMKSTQGIKKMTLIDDTFSSNPNGFLAAIKVLDKVKSKTKVVITPGIIELGSASARVHQEIAQALREKIDLIILTNDNFLADFKKGMGKSKTRLIVENKPKKIRGILSQESPKITVLLEGRLPINLIQTLKQ